MTQEQSTADDLRELLIEGTAGTQEEICEALIKKGHEVNQSKISRMLRKVGAVKSKNEYGEIVYRIPKEPAPPTINSQLASLILQVTSNENTIVVTTSPGSAAVVSRLLDYHREKIDILGTAAGDDTIIIIPKSIKNTQKTLVKIKEILSSKE